MSHTKKKRPHKRRGTQAGTIERTERHSRPRTKAEAKEEGRRRRLERIDQPPTWRSSLNRAAFAAIFLFLLSTFLLGNSAKLSILLAALALIFYIPMSYYTDRFIYRRRQRRGGGGSGANTSRRGR